MKINNTNSGFNQLFSDAHELLSSSEMEDIKAGEVVNSVSKSKECTVCVGCIVVAAIIIL
jgi:hypothetical protein